MKYELTKDQIEEIICCVVDCGMDRDEACDYALETAMEIMSHECKTMDCAKSIKETGHCQCCALKDLAPGAHSQGVKCTCCIDVVMRYALSPSGLKAISPPWEKR